MGTFTGDILRLLAAGGINTLTGALGEMISLPMKEKAAGRQMLAKQLIEGLGAVPEEAMPAANRKLVELLGRKGAMPTYQAPTGNVVGPGGESLAMTPVVGAPVTPETKERFLRPAVSMDAVLGSSIAQSPELREKILAIKAGGLTPKDLFDIQHKNMVFADSAEDRRLRREEAARSHMANEQLRKDTIAQNIKHSKDMLEIRRDLLEATKDKISDSAARSAYITLQNAHAKVLEQFNQAEKYGFDNMSGVKSAIDAHNELVSSIQKQFPNVAEINSIKPIELGTDTVPGKLWGTNEVPALKRNIPPIPSAKPQVFRGPDGKDYKEGDILPNGKPLRYVNGQWVF